jgi:hypothetical protein
MNPQPNAVNAFLARLAAQQRRLAARGRGLKSVDALTPAQFNRRIRAQMPPQVEELPLADQLLRNDRTRALVNNRLDRLTPEQEMRSLPAISRAYEDYQRQARMGEEAARLQRNSMMSDAAVPLAAALGAGGVMMAGSKPEEVAEEPLTLDDIAVLGAAAQAMDPADAMPVDEIDLGDFSGRFQDEYRTEEIPTPLNAVSQGLADYASRMMDSPSTLLASDLVEPEVGIDESDYDTEGLAEMILEAMDTPVVPGIEGLMDESVTMLDDGVDLGEQGFQGASEADMGRGLTMDDLVLERDNTPPRESPPDRDPYMTNAQKRTVQVLMNAGIPSERAGRIARGQASLSPAEYRMVTGGRR